MDNIRKSVAPIVQALHITIPNFFFTHSGTHYNKIEIVDGSKMSPDHLHIRVFTLIYMNALC